MKRAVYMTWICGVIAASSLVQQVEAQTNYPNKPIEFVVPSGAGGGADTSARLLANYVGKKKNITVNVVNKTGGGFIIGTNYALTSAPDGYTMLADSHGFSSLLAVVSPSLPFDWRKRTWIAKMSHDIPVYLVQTSSPFKSLKDVADFAKSNPGKLRWATAGPSGVSTAALVQFFGQSGVPAANVSSTHVVLKSGAEVVAALAGGHIEFAAQQSSEATGMIQSGKIRALSVVSTKRLVELPDVETVAESNFPKLDVVGWHGLSGPPGLSPEVTKFWLDITAEASKDPEFIDALLKANKVPAYLADKDLAAFVENEFKVYEGVFEFMKKK